MLSKIINQSVVLTAYHGYVVSVLKCNIMVWGHSINTDCVFKSQKNVYGLYAGYSQLKASDNFFIYEVSNNNFFVVDHREDIIQTVKVHFTCW